MKINYSDSTSAIRVLAMETTSYEIMDELASYDHWGVRWNLTKNENVDEKILDKLSNDSCPHVLIGIINHTKMSENKALDVLIENKDRLSKFFKQMTNPSFCKKANIIDFIKTHNMA